MLILLLALDPEAFDAIHMTWWASEKDAVLNEEPLFNHLTKGYHGCAFKGKLKLPLKKYQIQTEHPDGTMVEDGADFLYCLPIGERFRRLCNPEQAEQRLREYPRLKLISDIHIPQSNTFLDANELLKLDAFPICE